LLLSNALALEALPIFLDKIVPAYIAIFISTGAVVVFGEVLPQAFCTGEHKIKIGYYMSTFIKMLECILYPFVKPIVFILDKFIEHDEGKLILTHDKIKHLLLLHNKK
jgi:metal transporter CNNM